MEKNKGFIIILSLFVVITLSMVGMYFIGISQLSVGTSRIYYEDILVSFTKDSAMNIGYSKLLYALRNYGFFLPYENTILFTGEDVNFNGKLEEEEDTIINNGLIDTFFRGNLDIYSKIQPSIPTSLYTIGKFNVRPSYVVEKDKLVVAVFLRIIDASSKFNVKNVSLQIIKNVSNYIRWNDDQEFFKSTLKQVKSNEYGWFDKFKAKHTIIYNFFTPYSFSDAKVLKNVDYSSYHNKKIFSVLELYPTSIDFSEYSPININTANFDIMYNLFNGLKGYYFKTNSQNKDFPKIDSYHKKKQEDGSIGSLEIVEVNDTTARKLAEAILSLRRLNGTIKDFGQIEEFLLRHKFEKNIIDLVIANCKATPHSYKYNMPYFDDKTVDRFQLIEPTTTISFFPTGTFEFHYDIFVLNKPFSKVLYNFSDYAIVKLYDIETYSLNSDFENVRISPTQETVSGRAMDIYPQVKDEIDFVFGSYLGSALSKIYDNEELKGKVSFYLDLLGDITPSIFEGEKRITLSFKNFPKKGELYGKEISKLGNIFSDGVYFDNFSSLSFPLEKNIPPPEHIELGERLMNLYNSSLLAEIYELAQLYATPVRVIQMCISSYIKPNRFLGSYERPRVFFNVFSPVTNDYYSYVYFFSFLYPKLDGRIIKPQVFLRKDEKVAKDIFLNFGDTAGMAQLFGLKEDAQATIFDGNWHNVAFCISNTGFKDLIKSLNELGQFDIKMFLQKDWRYGPAYFKKLLDVLNVTLGYVRIYVDGKEMGESITFSSNSRKLVTNFLNIWKAKSFGIGVDAEHPIWNYPLDTSISHFAIWKKILSEEEINKFLKVNKYYSNRFSIEFDRSYHAVYLSIYSKDNIFTDCYNCYDFKSANSHIYVKKVITSDEVLKINFNPANSVPNNFIMIDNITLFRILPLIIGK